MASNPDHSRTAAGHGDAYRRSGVDIDAGNALVERIKPHVRASFRPGVMADLGGFGALFDLKRTNFRDPLLVSSTDGVGTKIRLAIDTGRHDGIGQDLVAMCVNDLVVQGAEPLFFLDYFACGALDVGVAERVIAGIARACADTGCALIGGETAEMPGMYAHGDYDLAGFAVGAVERDAVITGERITAGDCVIGIASSGLHSNGFSLVRRVIADMKTDINAPAPFDTGATLADYMLRPTRLYVRPVLDALRAGFDIRGIAHITGGGLLENIPRVLPGGLGARLDAAAWDLPPLFRWLADGGDLTVTDLSRTLNCGIGMIVIAPAKDGGGLCAALEQSGERARIIGTVAPHDGSAHRVTIADAARAWSRPE